MAEDGAMGARPGRIPGPGGDAFPAIRRRFPC